MENAEFGLNAMLCMASEPNSNLAISVTVVADKGGQDLVLSLLSVFLWFFFVFVFVFFSLRLIRIIEGNERSKITVCVHYMAVLN